MRWQLQEAKQRFSEVVRRAKTEGPQMVTRHGADVVVVLEVEEYRRLQGQLVDFKTFLRHAPDLRRLEIERDGRPARRVDLKS
jgi:prevent-host-death family protein